MKLITENPRYVWHKCPNSRIITISLHNIIVINENHFYMETIQQYKWLETFWTRISYVMLSDICVWDTENKHTGVVISKNKKIKTKRATFHLLSFYISLFQSIVSVMTKCLESCNKDGLRSVSVPTMGTGYLRYPSSMAAHYMLTGITQFISANPKSSLKLIQIVIHNASSCVSKNLKVCWHGWTFRKTR